MRSIAYDLAAGKQAAITRRASVTATLQNQTLLAFPGILLALSIIATLGSSLRNLMIAVGIAAIPDYVRIMRGTVLSLITRREVRYTDAPHRPIVAGE